MKDRFGWARRGSEAPPRWWRRRTAVLLAALALTAVTVSGLPDASANAAPAPPKAAQDWPMFGQNPDNTSSTPDTQKHQVTTANVAALAQKWVFTTGGDVSARAAVTHGAVYFPDWSGHLYAVNAKNGHALWSRDILKDYLPGVFTDPPAKVVSRTTPYVDVSTDTLYIGTQQGAWMLAVNTKTGALRWKAQLDTHPYAVDTAAPIVHQGVLYVGVSSNEEGAATSPGYPCCSFRGSVVALNAATGALKWKTPVVPEGYSGAAIWSSTIVPDPARGVVYTTTGNNYSTPTAPAYTSCISNGGTQESCTSPDDHFDSVVALRMTNGSVAWAQRLSSGDDWNLACLSGTPGPNCPQPTGSDYDFGSGVNLFTIQTATGPKTVLGAGQKSGVYAAFDPDRGGAMLWATQVGPGGPLGGVQWGSATDGKRIYVAISDYQGAPYVLQPSGRPTSHGSWGALDPATGKILWQTADPGGASDQGPLAVTNGVVFAPSAAGTGNNMFALNAETGSVLWGFASGGSVLAGAAIVDGTVYWGSGYSKLPGLTGNNKFYAFQTCGPRS
ncbi:PQQ-binding-like beta-propeller repeat protein [Streptomyces sp. NPDC006711]|uniref:outer membrane protein assembly factor BamB family protein n=1 Tax=Streptomyces sp. NPDC006711 TaxID=3364762 RepID=UPI0036B65C75